MNWMLKNSNGEYDGSWTLAVFSWVVVSLSILGSMLESVHVGSVLVDINVPSEALLLGYLATMTGNYLLRRNKKNDLASNESIEQMKNEILP